MSEDGRSAEDTSAQGGLITQRMAAERGRGVAILWLFLGAGWLVTVAVGAFDLPQDVLGWVLLVGRVAIGIAVLVMGGLQLRARAKRIALFNAEHGETAGIQNPSVTP